MRFLTYNKDKKKFYLFGKFCEWLSIKLYALMRSCELSSPRAEEIENLAKRRQNDIESARAVQEEVYYARDLILSKEEQLDRCVNLVKHIGISFRKGNYEEIDIILKELGI